MPVRSSAWRRSDELAADADVLGLQAREVVGEPDPRCPGRRRSAQTSVAPASMPSSGEMSPTRITIASPPASAPAGVERVVAAEADQVEARRRSGGRLRSASRSRTRGGAARLRAPYGAPRRGRRSAPAPRHSSRLSRSATSASSRIRRGSPSPGRTIRIRPSSRARTSASSTSCRPVESKKRDLAQVEDQRLRLLGLGAAELFLHARACGQVELTAHDDACGAGGKLALKCEWNHGCSTGTIGYPALYPTCSTRPRSQSHPVRPRTRAGFSIRSATPSTSSVLENARLLISELVANAVEHVHEDGDIEVRMTLAEAYCASRCSTPARASRPPRRPRGLRPRMGPALHRPPGRRAGGSTSTVARACGSSCRLPAADIRAVP